MWTKEQEELLRTLWYRGVGGTEIAQALGPQFNRNMVAGKAYRLGLPLRGHNGLIQSMAARKGSPKTRIEGTLRGHVGSVCHTGVPGKLKLIDLLPNSCRWPFGDPKSIDFGFCGRTRVDRFPYCAEHVKDAYQPPQVKIRTPNPAMEEVSASVTRRHKVTV